VSRWSPNQPRGGGLRWWDLSVEDRDAIRRGHPGWTENELSSYRWTLEVTCEETDDYAERS